MELFSLECDAALTGARVIGLRGSATLGQTYRYDLYLQLTAEADPELDAALGTRATLTVHDDTGAARDTVHGILSAAEWVEGTLLRVELVPALWLLSQGRHSRVWVDADFPTFLGDVLRGAGLGDDDFSLRLRARYRPVEHVCQYRESDLAFIQRWCEQLGVTFYFEHDGAREKAVFVDRSSDFPQCPGAIVSYFATDDEDGSTVEAFNAFAQRNRAATATQRVRDYNELQPSVAIDESVDAAVPGAGASVPMFEDDARSGWSARQAAQLRVESSRAEHERFHGSGRVFGLRPGAWFELEGHPRGAFHREYLAVEVSSRGYALAADDPAGSAVRALVGARPWRVDVGSIRRAVDYRPPRVTPLPRVDGVIVGHVDGPVDDDYAQLDGHGRYVVTLDLDERAHRAGEATTRLRMLQPHAGAPEGHHFPLRKGTEVLVAFVGGDPDRPMIVGAVPDADTPSPVTSSNHTQDVVHTGGDTRIEVEDTAGGQYIDISTPPEQTFVHLGAHHGGHRHNAIASTEGNGLVHQGANQDIFVDSDKTEDVHLAVTETYKQTQTTHTIQDVTQIYHATQTTKVDRHCKESYESHTTTVTGHKVERCASQETTVSNLLTEAHGSQDVVVDGLLKSTAATREFKATTQSAQFYANLTWNVGAGGFTVNDDSYLFVDAPNYTVLVPKVTEVQNVRTELAPTKWYSFKGTKTSRDTVKISMISATLSGVGAKFDSLIATIGVTPMKTSAIGFKLDLAGLKVENAMVEQSSGAFRNGKWVLKIWL